MALTLAGAWATVLCAGRTVKELEATARAITRKGGKAHVVPLDITDEEAVKAQVRAIIRKHRRIDVLVNNAGVIHRENIVDTATADFRKVIETDLISQFVLAREVGRHMLARRYGRIVNISSVMAILGRASVAGYVSAKHGLVGLTKNLSAEFGPHVTANAIAPGYIRTELNVPLQKNKEFTGMLERRTAAGRWGNPEDLRGALLLLASDAGAFITGHTLVVDGGLTTILA
jgi:NAD(P)-dependent dehydrogenase (short-subunit alcohol dehydrogenase family)